MKYNKSWFKIKGYQHIGLPLRNSNKRKILGFIRSDAFLKHSFLPFIHRKIKVRKFRKEYTEKGKKAEMRIASLKERDVYYASHLDSVIYGYYSDLISRKYENALVEHGTSGSVTAYRRIKLDSQGTKQRNKCSVDFANDVFTFLQESLKKETTVFTFDIKGFFDNLDHDILKEKWIKVMGFDGRLPSDHYKIYKGITKFSYVDERDLFKLFMNQIVVRKENEVKRISISKRKYFKKKKALAFCLSNDISRIRSHNLIHANKFIFENNTRLERKKGIPQGAPISSLLANIYMLDFDRNLTKMMKNVGGKYVRYSDDMILIFPSNDKCEVEKNVNKEVENIKLSIQKSKTQCFKFSKNENGDIKCFERNPVTFDFNISGGLEYLGFQYNGSSVLIKNSTLAGYYRKMKRAINRSKFYAVRTKGEAKGKIFKSKLYKKYTYRGASRRRIYVRHPRFSNKFILSHKYDWGNFITYAKLAERTFENNKIKSQIRRHWSIFHSLLEGWD